MAPLFVLRTCQLISRQILIVFNCLVAVQTGITNAAGPFLLRQVASADASANRWQTSIFAGGRGVRLFSASWPDGLIVLCNIFRIQLLLFCILFHFDWLWPRKDLRCGLSQVYNKIICIKNINLKLNIYTNLL